jgi:hypothetical protein
MLDPPSPLRLQPDRLTTPCAAGNTERDGTLPPIFARARDQAEPTPEPQPDPDDVFVAIEKLFKAAFGRLDKIDSRLDGIDRRLDALEAKAAQPPANRIIKHVRGSDGQITKSILVSDGQ